mgnify:CR=1 FL=1
MRKASCSTDISMLNTAADLPAPRAAFSAMFSASVVLPMDGRPAMMIRSPLEARRAAEHAGSRATSSDYARDLLTLDPEAVQRIEQGLARGATP